MRARLPRRLRLPRPTTADRGVVTLVGLLCTFIVLGTAGAGAWLTDTADDMAGQVFAGAQYPARQLQVFYTEVTETEVPADAANSLDRALPPALDRLLAPPRHSVVTTEAVPHALPRRNTDSPAFITVAGFPDARSLVHIVEGRFPRPGVREVRLSPEAAAAYDGPRRAPVVEVALERRAAKLMNLPVGTYVNLTARGFRRYGDEPLAILRVAGTYDAATAYPSPLDDVDNARGPAVSTLPEFTLVRTAALAADDRTMLEATWATEPEVRWTFDPEGLPTAEEAEAAVPDARRLAVQPWPAVLDSTASVAATGIGDLASTFVEERDASNTLAGLVLASLAAAALALLLAAASVLEARRREVSDVLRARGAPSSHLAAIRATEAVLICAPGLASAGLLLLFSRLSTRDFLGAVLAAGSCIVLLTVAQVAPARQLPERVQQSVRDALHIVAVVLAVALTALMLWRGRIDASDPLLLALPAVIGLAATVLVVRGVRLLTGVTQRLAGRSRRVAPLVGVSQAGTAAQHVVLPVVAVVLASCCALLSVSVGDTVRRGAQEAAWQSTGADVLVTGGFFDPEVTARIERLPGVTALAGVQTANGVLDTRVGPQQVAVMAVDPGDLARVTAGTPTPIRVADSTEQTLRVAASPDLSLDGEETTLDYAQASVPVEVAGRLDRIPGVTGGGPFVVVDEEAFRAAVDRPVSSYDSLLISGSPDPGRLRSVVREAAPLAKVRTRQEATAATLDDTVVTRTLLVARASAVTAVLLALFAAGLAVALNRPLRRRTADILHALGADARQARRVNALELVPSLAGAGLAAVACVVVLAAVVGRGTDLTALTGSEGDLTFGLAPVSWLFAVAALCSVVVLGAWASTWNRLANDKRTPDEETR